MESTIDLTRMRRLTLEALNFGVIGGINAIIYLIITWVGMPFGVVKSNIVAAAVTTTLAFFANRHWTYRNSPRRTLRREYTLFFAFNLAGMVIQGGGVAVAKYGFHFNEVTDKPALMVVTMVALCTATVFRFAVYRRFVFLRPGPGPVNARPGTYEQGWTPEKSSPTLEAPHRL